nr:MAG: RNA-dependent RNA polymerase [Riboviria sp.]
MRYKLPFTNPIVTYDSCSANELLSLVNRHLVTNEHLVDSQQELWLATYDHYVCVRPPQKIMPVSLDEVVQSKRGSKKKQYRRALESLRVKPLTQRDANIKMFVKNERMTLTVPPKAPRAIQSRSPRYNLHFQQFTIAYSKLWYKNIPLDDRVCTKGMNQLEIASWIVTNWAKYSDPVADLYDHSFFDSKQNSLAIFYQNKYVDSCFNDPEYNELYKQRINNKCYTRNGIRYKVVATRLSGDGDTSDGNSTLNDMMLCYVNRGLRHSRCLIGDDSIVIRERSDGHLVDRESLAAYGFATKHAIANSIADIEYCQCKPVHTQGGWLMVRDPQRVISRGTVCIDRSINTLDLYKRWCRGVGDCEVTCNRGVPVLQAFAKFMQRATDSKAILDREFEYHQLDAILPEQITDTARVSFYEAFGITVSMQLHLEQMFDGLSWDVDLLRRELPSDPTCTYLISCL